MKGFTMTEEQVAEYNSRSKTIKASLVEAYSPEAKQAYKSQPQGTRSAPNKTESEYARLLALEFPGASITFEGLTFKLRNSHRYTPDWIVNSGDGQVVCVEVKARGKNGFRFASYGRARLAFDQAKLDWPNYQWRWAEKHNGIWEVK